MTSCKTDDKVNNKRNTKSILTPPRQPLTSFKFSTQLEHTSQMANSTSRHSRFPVSNTYLLPLGFLLHISWLMSPSMCASLRSSSVVLSGSTACDAKNRDPCKRFPGLCSTGGGLCVFKGPCEYECVCPPDGRRGRDCTGGDDVINHQREEGGESTKSGSLVNSLLVFPQDLFWDLNHVLRPEESVKMMLSTPPQNRDSTISSSTTASPITSDVTNLTKMVPSNTTNIKLPSLGSNFGENKTIAVALNFTEMPYSSPQQSVLDELTPDSADALPGKILPPTTVPHSTTPTSATAKIQVTPLQRTSTTPMRQTLSSVKSLNKNSNNESKSVNPHHTVLTTSSRPIQAFLVSSLPRLPHQPTTTTYKASSEIRRITSTPPGSHDVRASTTTSQAKTSSDTNTPFDITTRTNLLELLGPTTNPTRFTSDRNNLPQIFPGHESFPTFFSDVIEERVKDGGPPNVAMSKGVHRVFFPIPKFEKIERRRVGGGR